MVEKSDYHFKPNHFRENTEFAILNEVFKTQFIQNHLTVTINSKEKLDFDLNSLRNLDSLSPDRSLLNFEKESNDWKIRLYVESGSSSNGRITDLTWSVFLTKK